MDDALIDWDDPNDLDGNTAHIAEHGLTPEDVESALRSTESVHDLSGSSGRPVVFGSTQSGRRV